MVKKVLSVTLLLVVLLTGCATSVYADDLMKGITPASVDGKAADNAFANAVAHFSIELFKNCFSDKESSLISPTSVLLALAMTANGADETTLAQMEQVLGGGMSIKELNEYLYSYRKSLPSEKKAKLSSGWKNVSAIALKLCRVLLSGVCWGVSVKK